jgi:hypothetical protein
VLNKPPVDHRKFDDGLDSLHLGETRRHLGSEIPQACAFVNPTEIKAHEPIFYRAD